MEKRERGRHRGRRIMEGKYERRETIEAEEKNGAKEKGGDAAGAARGPARTFGRGMRRSTVAHFACKVRGGEYCGGQARAENPTKSWPRALTMFATCSWPSLCEQSELQCWRRNRRLCGPVQISAARALPLTFDKTNYKRGVIEGYFITPLKFSLPVYY